MKKFIELFKEYPWLFIGGGIIGVIGGALGMFIRWFL